MVVSRNRVERLRKCLQSLEASDERERLQLIVVDNGSTDGAASLDDEFPNVQFIRLPKDFGLTKAMNIGWRAADAEYVFFLHDDTEVPAQAAQRLADHLDADRDVAAVCPLLVDSQGAPAPQLGSFPPDGNWQPAAVAGNDSIAVEYPRGAAFMMRVALIKAVRQIDERFGQFGGDADLAAQINRAGKKILLLPSVRVVHHGNDGYTAAEQADFLLAKAAFAGKYFGFGAGLQARLSSVFGPLFSFKFSVLSRTVAGQKIDGTQS